MGCAEQILKSNFLSNVAPSLEELTLEGFAFPWGSGSSTLTKLSVSQPIYFSDWDWKYTLLDVARTLRQMPALQSLSLIDMLPGPPDDIQTANMDFISLPHLKELALVSDSASCWHLWSWMAVQAPRTDIQCTRDTDHLVIASALQAHIATVPAPYTFADICIPLSSQRLIFLLEEAVYLPETSLDPYVPGRFPYTLSLRIVCSNPTELARKLLDMTSKDKFTDLELSGSFGDTKFFYDTFLLMNPLHTLSLRGDESGIALAAMAASSSIGEDEDEALFSGLCRLECEGMDFSKLLDCCGQNLPLQEILERVLHSWKSIEAPLSELCVEECDVREEWVDKWRKLVDELEWDGDEGTLKEQWRCSGCEGYES